MSSDQEVKNTLRQAMSIAAISKNNIENYSQETRDVIHRFNVMIESNKAELEKMLENAHETLYRTMTRSVETAINSSVEEIEQKLKKSTNVLLNAVDQFHQHKNDIMQQTKWLSWKSLIMFFIGFTIVVAATVALTLKAKEKRDVMISEYKTAKQHYDIIAAEERMIKSRCGEEVCIKIDPKAKHWGGRMANTLFVLVPI